MQKLKDRVSEIYYTHGLVCSSHPWPIILAVICLFCVVCYPLLNIPLPGNAPLQWHTPVAGYTVPPVVTNQNMEKVVDEDPNWPIWFYGPPVTYVQQIIIKSTVSPWQPNKMSPSDAFRAPLSKVFQVLEHLNNFQYIKGDQKLSLADVCIRVAETVPSKRLQTVLPQYSCFILSPGNFWNQDINRFQSDGEIIKTIYKLYGASNIEMVPPLRELLFGLAWIETGISKYFLRNRQRVISYSVTIMLKEYDENFISTLKEKLYTAFPLSRLSANATNVETMAHVYFKDVHNYLVEYTYLILAYVVLFLYLYFSVRKIEMVKSKWGLAVSAVAMVIASLLSSISICTVFGLSPSLNGGEIFPYLVVIVGLENVLVLTKSVVSTPVDLDVKQRVALGLSKEGWSITKNLVMELLILFVGFFTFVPAIQEFCLFAVVGLCTDFFLQIVFFVTVLSIDIRRMELSDLNKQRIHQRQEGSAASVPKKTLKCPVMETLNNVPTSPGYGKFPRSKSTPGIYYYPHANHSPPPSPIAHDGEFYYRDYDPTIMNLPKRIRLIYFWARTRMVQRIIMVCTVIWIALIVHKTGLVEHLTQQNQSSVTPGGSQQLVQQPYSLPPNVEKFMKRDAGQKESQKDLSSLKADRYQMPEHSSDSGGNKVDTQEVAPLLHHSDGEMWKKLSYKHWPALLDLYNTSLSGRYISILPSIHLSIPVSPDDAIAMRHPTEQEQWKSRQSTLSSDESMYNMYLPQSQMLREKLPIDPMNSMKELIVTIVLGVMSIFLGIYFIMVLYRCMCSRNYAKWRSSWSRTRKKNKNNPYYKIIKESVPIRLVGHVQEVECIITDGPFVVSSCLGGQIRVWDSNSGECLTTINRKCVTPPMQRKPALGRNINDSDSDLYAEYHESTYSDSSLEISQSPQTPKSAPPKIYLQPEQSVIKRRRELFADMPDLSGTINTDFSSNKERSPRPSIESNFQISPKNNSPSQSVDGSSRQSEVTCSSNLQTPGGTGISAMTSQTPSEGTIYQHRRVRSQGFDFSKFNEYYEEHRILQQEKRQYEAMKELERLRRESQTEAGGGDAFSSRYRSRSVGSQPNPDDAVSQGTLAPSVWCLTCQDNLIVVGCGNGRIEFWEGLSGSLKCIYDESKEGVTALCFVGKRVIAARLDGTLDFLELETFSHPPVQSSPIPPSLHNRGSSRPTHRRSSSYGRLKPWDDVIHCTHNATVCAHQQPINLVQLEGGRVVTASQDHTLKVFRLEDSLCLYTLHGHTEGVTALYLDKGSPLGACSGSEDGSVRLWDLLTGACAHKLKCHETTVTSLVCSPVHVISSAMDDKLCIWDRCKGVLLHCVQLEPGYCNSLTMLTSNLLVSGGQGCILLWDICKGELLRNVRLGENNDYSVFVRHVLTIGNSVVISGYGNQLRVVHFPAVLEKAD